MTGFEPRTSGTGSDRSTNRATTTFDLLTFAFSIFFVGLHFHIILSYSPSVLICFLLSKHSNSLLSSFNHFYPTIHLTKAAANCLWNSKPFKFEKMTTMNAILPFRLTWLICSIFEVAVLPSQIDITITALPQSLPLCKTQWVANAPGPWLLTSKQLGISVTRWLDYFSIFGHFQQWKWAQ